MLISENLFNKFNVKNGLKKQDKVQIMTDLKILEGYYVDVIDEKTMDFHSLLEEIPFNYIGSRKKKRAKRSSKRSKRKKKSKRGGGFMVENPATSLLIVFFLFYCLLKTHPLPSVREERQNHP